MIGKIGSVYDVSEACEISINYGGCNYLTIFGHHINGWFISVINWGKSVEAAHPTDIFYNSEKLSKHFGEEVATALARTIATYWEITREEKKDEAT